MTSENKPKKIYLAGPDVFRKDAIAYGAVLKKYCELEGFEGLYPFDNEIDAELKGQEAAKAIFEANVRMIDECDAVLANLTPFRGPSADVGTVWEIGYAKAKGKLILGYTEVYTAYKHRVKKDEYNVEDFKHFDNLMIAQGVDNVYLSFGMALMNLRSKL